MIRQEEEGGGGRMSKEKKKVKRNINEAARKLLCSMRRHPWKMNIFN